jgi:hypothetical protein
MGYHRFCEAMLGGRPITIHGDGHQERANTFVDDVVVATVAALDRGRSGEIYNVGRGPALSSYSTPSPCWRRQPAPGPSWVHGPPLRATSARPVPTPRRRAGSWHGHPPRRPPTACRRSWPGTRPAGSARAGWLRPKVLAPTCR